MTTAPRGAVVVSLVDRRLEQRLHTRQGSPKQLCEPLRRLKCLREALDNWDRAGGPEALPQPADFDLSLPSLRPSEVRWRAAS